MDWTNCLILFPLSVITIHHHYGSLRSGKLRNSTMVSINAPTRILDPSPGGTKEL
jgi:hypothetical protein